jgi:hypothetical protein
MCLDVEVDADHGATKRRRREEARMRRYLAHGWLWRGSKFAHFMKEDEKSSVLFPGEITLLSPVKFVRRFEEHLTSVFNT